ncbi:cinnamoyl-CoA reductase CAD2-like isoform X3 [Actinidia eriantha]|uniref:cinnamoyl-CoA reductase CAD2-like isoform X3 n=1 Tax=Actinidia eriantha TaxID=165200 RepID=UPI002585C3E8|nr:cinnamoyl-CoA reductase CAD2-like isoform X3 [Actinidia eriantha]
MSGAGKVVCVTGASGFIASWLVKLLLLRGYTVKASVRDPSDQRKTEHLLALDGANERLHLFQADLLDEGSFDPVVDGCEGVFHTASPVQFSVSDPQLWYPLSKTLAEEAAWKFAKEYGIDMITMNPGWVIGPLLQRTLNSTVEVVFNLINGAKSYPNAFYRWVDVRDVASAHIQALEISSASGRYCVVDKAAHFSEVVKILHQLYPALDLPEKCDSATPFQLGYHVVNEKVKRLGIEFTPLEVSLKDTVESLKEKNFLSLTHVLSCNSSK